MNDYLTLGTAPAEEECGQVGKENAALQMRAECKAYERLLERTFGESPEGVYFKTKGFQHDYGTYYEVCVFFDNEDEDACEYAYKCENEMPLYWDEIALNELKEKGFPRQSNKPVEAT